MDGYHTSKFINALLDFLQSQSLLAFFWREFGMVVYFLEKKEVPNIEISHL
jgi:hypothetical protein